MPKADTFRPIMTFNRKNKGENVNDSFKLI